MGRKSKESFLKKKKAEKKKKKKDAKFQKRIDKKNQSTSGTFEDMIAYVDEMGNIISPADEETEEGNAENEQDPKEGPSPEQPD